MAEELQQLSVKDPPIENPPFKDSEKFNGWLDKFVKKPFKGFDDLTHPNGATYSIDEQIEASKQQLRTTAKDFIKLQLPDKTITEVLKQAVEGLYHQPNIELS